MRRSPRAAVALTALVLLAAAGTCLPAHPVAEAQRHLAAAAAAYGDGDYDAYTAALERAFELNPASLYTRYNLACGYALTGRHDDALELLAGLVAARVDFGMAGDPDLAALGDRPEFEALVAELAAATAPIGNSTLRAELDELGLIPEGIAADAATGRLFFGSMRTGEIFVLDPDDRLWRFAILEDGARLAAIGMTVDPVRELLWAVGSTFSLTEGYDAGEPPRAGIFGFDLTTGELRERHLVDPSITGVNDVALGPDGSLYVSASTLQVLNPGAGTLAPLATSVALYGANGLTTDPEGRWLFVSSYPVGIAVVEIATGRTRLLEAPDDVTLYGIDGLYWYGDGLVAVQNGVRPWRLLRLGLDEARASVESVRILELANERLTPTTGAVVDGEIHYVGQGPAAEPAPAHFPEELAEFLGRTLIMTAALD